MTRAVANSALPICFVFFKISYGQNTKLAQIGMTLVGASVRNECAFSSIAMTNACQEFLDVQLNKVSSPVHKDETTCSYKRSMI
jgi:hypothetical protein